MKLSVIIITKNEENYLPKLLDSIRKQKVDFDYDIIVSDANSTDKTRDIAKKYGCRVIDGGLPSKGRNNGAKVSNGKYLLFLDADVILEKNSLQSWLNKIEQKKADLLIPYYIGYEKDKISDKIFSYGWLITTIFLHNISKTIAGGACILIKKSVYGKIGGFDEKLYLGEDFELFKKVVKNGFKRINSFPYVNVSIRRIKNIGLGKFMWNNIKYPFLFMFGKKLDNKYKDNYDLNYKK